MFGLVLTIHTIVCILLILVVLLQAGRGGGLIESSFAESLFGTKTSSFLVKFTSILATLFLLTCLILTFLSKQKTTSLIEKEGGVFKTIQNMSSETKK